jgi:hypothetical protein
LRRKWERLKITGGQGSHNKSVGCGASGAYVPGPDDEEKEEVTLGHVFLRILRFSRVRIPPMLHTNLYLHVAPTRSTNGRSVASFQKAFVFRKLGNIEENIVFTFFCIYLHWVNTDGTCSCKTKYATQSWKQFLRAFALWRKSAY